LPHENAMPCCGSILSMSGFAASCASSNVGSSLKTVSLPQSISASKVLYNEITPRTVPPKCEPYSALPG
jgi:hypothetical protein